METRRWIRDKGRCTPSSDPSQEWGTPSRASSGRPGGLCPGLVRLPAATSRSAVTSRPEHRHPIACPSPHPITCPSPTRVHLLRQGQVTFCPVSPGPGAAHAAGGRRSSEARYGLGVPEGGCMDPGAAPLGGRCLCRVYNWKMGPGLLSTPAAGQRDPSTGPSWLRASPGSAACQEPTLDTAWPALLPSQAHGAGLAPWRRDT